MDDTYYFDKEFTNREAKGIDFHEMPKICSYPHFYCLILGYLCHFMMYSLCICVCKMSLCGLCVCVCASVCTHMHCACVCSCVQCACMQGSVHAWMCWCEWFHMHASTWVRVHGCLYVLRECLPAYRLACLTACLSVCLFVCVYTSACVFAAILILNTFVGLTIKVKF